MSDPVRALVSRALEGDRQALRWLYDTFAPGLLRRLGMRFGGYRGFDREDLLQDTFVYLLGGESRALRRFLEQTPESEQNEAALERFLWSAACGVASNRRRSALRHPERGLDGEAGSLSIKAGEGPAIARDALEKLGECLARGGESHYLYFQLRYLDGLKPNEIVKATGWSRKKTYKLKQVLDQALELCLEVLGISP